MTVQYTGLGVRSIGQNYTITDRIPGVDCSSVYKCTRSVSCQKIKTKYPFFLGLQFGPPTTKKVLLILPFVLVMNHLNVCLSQCRHVGLPLTSPIAREISSFYSIVNGAYIAPLPSGLYYSFSLTSLPCLISPGTWSLSYRCV